LEILFELLFSIVLELSPIIFIGVGYVAGFLPVLIGSLGTIEPGPIECAADGDFYRSKGMRIWHLTYVDEGKRYLPAETVALVGWALVIALSVFIWAMLQALV